MRPLSALLSNPLKYIPVFKSTAEAMVSHMSLQPVIQFIQAALECSVYVEPREPGLTREEVFEVGKRAGFQDGEIGDALAHARLQHSALRYLLPGSQAAMWHIFIFREEPDYRNLTAFDFALSELQASVRAEGVKNAQL